MTAPREYFQSDALSLSDLLGEDFVDAVYRAQSALSGGNAVAHLREQRVDLYPEAFQQSLRDMLPLVGTHVIGTRSLSTSAGAGPGSFEAASTLHAAALGGAGYFRVGEDGRLYLVAKSEHYQASLGHAFPGFALIRRAERLGISNPAHNNTRGHITRLLERELVRVANGIRPDDTRAIKPVLESRNPQVLNRVLNLSTGSLAVEAALKMILSRFYETEGGSPKPRYAGFKPVVLVMGDDDGGLRGNYHGTTILTQVMRGMWPGFAEQLEASGLLTVRAVRPNRREDLDRAFREYMTAPRRIAGFFHEIVMMNYGARLLDREFLAHAYALCREHDVPVVDDEIQTGLWSPEMLMFREYGLEPSMVAVGKGFPGGQSAASRLLYSAVFDTLPQFGALVTNGQEELSALAYLIAVRAVEGNSARIAEVGDYYAEKLRLLAAQYPEAVLRIEGSRHLSGITFESLSRSKEFVAELNAQGIDISVQAYKNDCPPVVLTKLPLIADEAVVDFLVGQMEEALARVLDRASSDAAIA